MRLIYCAGYVPSANYPRGCDQNLYPRRTWPLLRRSSLTPAPASEILGSMSAFAQDLRYAVRTLVKSPAFTVVVVLDARARHRRQHRDLFADRSGAAAAAAGQVARAARRARRPGRVPGADLQQRRPSRTRCIATSAIRTRCSTASSRAFPAPLTLMTNGQAERVNGELVSGNYFDVLGVRAHIGRTFTQDDDRTPGGHPVAMLTYSFWTRRFAARSRRAQPQRDAQRPADDHRRRHPARLLRHRRRRKPRRARAGDDEGADDADLGRSAEPAQPLADRDGAAEAGRLRRRRPKRR